MEKVTGTLEKKASGTFGKRHPAHLVKGIQHISTYDQADAILYYILALTLLVFWFSGLFLDRLIFLRGAVAARGVALT